MTENLRNYGVSIRRRHCRRCFGIIGIARTTVGASAIQAVSIGIPKILVSTVASGNTCLYVGVKDISMTYLMVDIAWINALSGRNLSLKSTAEKNSNHVVSPVFMGIKAAQVAAKLDKDLVK